MKSLVLSGGPCSAKSTILEVLGQEFGGEMVHTPEAATMLMGKGFPMPGRDLPWSEEWQKAFQSAILPLQRSLEEAWALVGAKRGAKILVCDRGTMDGAAYTPGGVEAFGKIYGVDPAAEYARYEAVIHLESLATAIPERYGKTGNEQRFEPLDRAQELEQATRDAWKDHPHWVFIPGTKGVEAKISQVVGIIRYLLTVS